MDYAYTDRGQVDTVTRYADLAGATKVGTTAYTYDDAGHVTGIVTRDGSGGILADYGYTYDLADWLDSKTEGGVATTYAYDKTGQLTQDGATGHGYDQAGNRADVGYATGPGNRLQSDGVWAYTYDDAGELVKKSKGASAETWTYGYDHRGQMVWAEDRATDGGTLLARVEYAYDAFGNRVRRVQYDGSLAVVSDQRYALDGWDTAKPGAVGAENFDTFADLDAAGNVTARRVFGPGFDEPVARLDPSGEVGWYGTDSQDSVRLIFDNTGTVTGSRDYTAFGAITAESGAGLDRYAYTAREWDAALGLQSNRQRMYDPATGRFTSEDPSGLSAGDVNLFRYAGNAVTTHTDPSGLQGFWDDVKMVGDYVLNNPVSAAVNFNVSQVETIGQLATKIPVETAKGFDQLGRMMIDVAGYNMVAAGRAAGYDLTYTPYSALGQQLAALPPGEQRAMALANFAADALSLGAKQLGEAIGDYIADGDTNKFLDRIAGIVGMNFLGAGMAKAGRPAEAYGKEPCPKAKTAGNGSRVGTSLRDPKSVADFTRAEQLDLQLKHRALISRLEQGDVPMPPGAMAIRHPVTGLVTTSPTQLMGELTVATGREVALVRIGNQRWLRLGKSDGVVVIDADRVIAHTHPSGELRFSVGPDSDMTVFTNPLLNLAKQKSSVLVAPDGTAVRLPIQR